MRRQATQTQGIAGGRGLYKRSSRGGQSSGTSEYTNGNMQSRKSDFKTEPANKVVDQSAMDRPEEKVLHPRYWCLVSVCMGYALSEHVML